MNQPQAVPPSALFIFIGLIVLLLLPRVAVLAQSGDNIPPWKMLYPSPRASCEHSQGPSQAVFDGGYLNEIRVWVDNAGSDVNVFSNAIDATITYHDFGTSHKQTLPVPMEAGQYTLRMNTPEPTPEGRGHFHGQLFPATLHLAYRGFSYCIDIEVNSIIDSAQIKIQR